MGGVTVEDALLDVLWDNPDSTALDLANLLAKQGVDLTNLDVGIRLGILLRRGYSIQRTPCRLRKNKVYSYRLLKRELENPEHFVVYTNGDSKPKYKELPVENLGTWNGMTKIRYVGYRSKRVVTTYWPADKVYAKEVGGEDST